MADSYQKTPPTNQPIFVIGYMHSGTTLLQKIIGRNEKVFSGRGESRFFAHYDAIRSKFPNLADDRTMRNYVRYLIALLNSGYSTVNYHQNDQATLSQQQGALTDAQFAQLIEAAKSTPQHAQIFVLVNQYLANAANKTHWIEKTPRHIFHIDRILATVPTALFVEIVRDPRDILASKLRRQSDEWIQREHESQYEAYKLFGGYDPLWDTIGWTTAIRAGNLAAQQHPDRILRVRYEDLVESPQVVVKKLCDFLGLTYTDTMLDVASMNTSVQVNQATTGISNASKGKWKKTLAPEAVAICQLAAATEMQIANYEREPVNFTAYGKAALTVVYSGFEFFQRLYRRWQLGGTRLLRTVISDYWLRSKKYTKLTSKL